MTKQDAPIKTEASAQRGLFETNPRDNDWRVSLLWRDQKGNNFATTLSWTNARAQALACEMLGLTTMSLPRLISARQAFRSLSLHILMTASERFNACFSEASSSDPRSAGDFAISRALIFDEADMTLMSAGLLLMADATGGSVTFTGKEIEASARHLAAPFSNISASMSDAVAERPEISCDEERGDVAWVVHDGAKRLFDLRAAARHLGLPFGASVAAAADDFGLVLGFIDRDLVVKSLADAPLGALPPDLYVNEEIGASRSASSLCKNTFEARQEAERLQAATPSPVSDKRKLRSL